MNSYHDKPYIELLVDILKNGRKCVDRTGTGTIKVFSRQMRFDLSDGTIPLLTTKKMHIPAILHEIIWYLSGNSNIKYLQDNGVRIWNEWADENGDLGPVYGYQWRHWEQFEPAQMGNGGMMLYRKKGEVDQIADVINRLKTKPDDRRIIVSAWNVGQLEDMNLPPCHYTFQFFSTEMTREERVRWFTFYYGSNDLLDHTEEYIDQALGNHNVPTRSLSCMLNQRSCDTFLGVPFNIVQYSILTRMICEVVDMAPGEFIWNGGDTHIYLNHVEQVMTQIGRDPYPSPTLKFARPVDNIDDFGYDDFVIDYQQFHPTIKAKVSV